MGGVLIPRKLRPIRLTRVWSDKPGRYDEPIGYQIIGVETDNDSVRTRVHVWTIEYKPPQKSIFRKISETYFVKFPKILCFPIRISLRKLKVTFHKLLKYSELTCTPIPEIFRKSLDFRPLGVLSITVRTNNLSYLLTLYRKPRIKIALVIGIFSQMFLLCSLVVTW